LKLLALDLGSHCGWATFFDGIRHSGVETFDLRRGESPGMRFLRFHRWLVDLPKPELCLFEQAHHRGGFSTAVALGFQAHLLSWCAQNGIEHQPIHTATLKKWLTGHGHAGKPDMIAGVCRRGFHLAGPHDPCSGLDDNEADALALLAYGQANLVADSVIVG